MPVKFPKVHGIDLAANGFIKNARFEQLATDPTPVAAGRIWYNTTEKAMKLSSLDGGGAVVVQTFSTAEEFAVLEALVNTINGDSSTEGSFRKAIADVVGAAPEALNTLQEIAAAMNNDPDLYNTLVNLVNTGLDDLNQEILGTATTAMDTLGEVEAAITALQNQVSGAQTELDATQSGAGLNTDGSYAGRTGSNYLDSATSLADEATKLDAALKTESDRAKAAEGDTSTLTTTSKTLTGAVNELHAAAGAGADALKTAINGKRKTFKSDTAALVHIFTHNLNSEFLDVKVMVQEGAGLYYNDIVSVEETDMNTATVTLTEASNVKITAQDMTDLA